MSLESCAEQSASSWRDVLVLQREVQQGMSEVLATVVQQQMNWEPLRQSDGAMGAVSPPAKD